MMPAKIIHSYCGRLYGARPGTMKAAANPKYVATIAVIVTLGSLTSLYFSQLRHPTPKANYIPSIGLGQALAAETAKTLGDRGVVVLLGSNTRSDPDSFEHHTLEGFLEEIKTHPQIKILATETYRIDEAPVEDAGRYMGITSDQFVALLKEHHGADAFISFIPLPPFHSDHPLELPPSHPKIIAAQLPIDEGKAYLRNQVIVAFIANRPEPLATKTAPRTPREWFDKYFQLVTRHNIDAQP